MQNVLDDGSGLGCVRGVGGLEGMVSVSQGHFWGALIPLPVASDILGLSHDAQLPMALS